MLPAPMMPTPIFPFLAMSLGAVCCTRLALTCRGATSRSRCATANTTPRFARRTKVEHVLDPGRAQTPAGPGDANLATADAELKGSHDGCEPELSLADQRLGVDRQPGFTLRRQDIVAVQVLV